MAAWQYHFVHWIWKHLRKNSFELRNPCIKSNDCYVLCNTIMKPLFVLHIAQNIHKKGIVFKSSAQSGIKLYHWYLAINDSIKQHV